MVVFQGIEIERLSLEVEALRVQLKDAERQKFNSGNFEVQIRELTEKCFSLEVEREEYREEIEKMNMISQQLYDELEEMKRRYAEVDLTLKEKYRLANQERRGSGRTRKVEEPLQRPRNQQKQGARGSQNDDGKPKEKHDR